MGPLISFDEALALGELTGEEEIGELVERAWKVRQENFGDSTDMCSLVNAKSGGCAEDCGFCAQSRYAEADTPMHAMMEPEQILEHAKAAEAAGAHRFCMVTQGQGLSKRDFAKILEGAELVAEQTNLKRCASIGHMSSERAQALREAGIQRVHHNVESARSYYPEVSTTVRYEGRLRTIEAVKEAGLETCVGGILNLGESPRQRVEMAFELSELNPTSVPINLLNPREGTKFGDRPLMDAWEVVKWVAIFRLIIPGALFRLCGGRVENLADLQPLAVKAGLNGVMMGNFLTTLGAEPEDDRAMFEELGLNVARQDDNGANPRPDNRSGWLEGETPSTPIDELIDRQDEADFWDPSTQLRVIKKTQEAPSVPEPDRGMTDVAERLEELRDRGLRRRLRLVSGPQGPRVLLDDRPVLLLCSNDYLGFAHHPQVRAAAAAAADRWGAGAGASRLISGNMTPHRLLEQRLAAFKGHEAALLFGSGYLANTGTIPALAPAGSVVFSDELNHASIIDGCRLARAETFVYRHRDVEHLAWGLRRAGGAAAGADRHRRGLLDGRRRGAARGPRMPGAGPRGAADGRRGPRHGGARPGRPRLGRRRRPDRRGRRRRRHAGQGARLLRRLRLRRGRGGRVPAQQRPPLHLLDGAAAALGRRRRRRARPARSGAAPGRAAARATPPSCARRWPPRGSPWATRRPRSSRSRSATRRPPWTLCERALDAGVFAQGIRPPTVPEGSSRLRFTVMATHREAELRAAAVFVGAAARELGIGDRRRRPRRPLPRRLALAVEGVFVTGTGTEVGKTVVAAAIARTLAAAGRRVAVFKPAVTGLDDPGEPDHALLRRAAGSAQATRRSRPTATGRRPPPPRRGARRRADRPRPAAHGGRRGAARRPRRWSARASAGCWCRSRPATWCATWPSTSACRWRSPPRRAWGRSTTRCSRSRRRAAPASRCRWWCSRPGRSDAGEIERSNRETIAELARGQTRDAASA